MKTCIVILFNLCLAVSLVSGRMETDALRYFKTKYFGDSKQVSDLVAR